MTTPQASPGPVPSIPPAAPQTTPPAMAAMVSWPQVALAVVTASFTLGSAWLAGHTTMAATTAQRAVVITQQQLDTAVARRSENEAKIEAIEKRVRALEEKIKELEAQKR